ncbi:MAG: DUF1015 domain-containing protein [bacterium]
MTEIKPFKGTRYNSKLVDLSMVVAPPYDVINEEQQEMYYKKHPYNVIRLILGKQHVDDNEMNNRYTRARKFLDEWLQSGVLITDDKPSIYVYIQRFKVNNKTYERHGFIALLRLESDVFTHEKTLSKPKQDRFELMKACEANLSPIFVLYDDEKRCVECITISPKIHTLLAHIKEKDEEHIFYRVTDEKVLNTVQKMLSNKRVYIADGHHRYETAIRYRDYMFSLHGRNDNASYNYVMTYFTNVSDEGLVILPTHRVVHDVPYTDKEFLERIKPIFDVEVLHDNRGKLTLDKWTEEIEKRGKAFGVKFFGNDNFYVLYNYRQNKLKNDPTHEVLKSLDVYILNKEILEGVLNIPESSFSTGGRLSYFHKLDEAIASMKKGDMIFVLNPPSTQDVKAVALHSLNMPQKTTFFYPKLLSGLVFHLFNR